jgi:hypothetical protein
MIAFVTGFGPEIPQAVFELVDRLEQRIRSVDHDVTERKGRFRTIVVNLIVIDPARGAIPNSTSLKRLSGELWSSWNIDFATFLSADDRQKEELLMAATCEALAALEGKYLDGADVRRMIDRIKDG